MKTREQIEKRLEQIEAEVNDIRSGKFKSVVLTGHILCLINVEKESLQWVLESCPN